MERPRLQNRGRSVTLDISSAQKELLATGVWGWTPPPPPPQFWVPGVGGSIQDLATDTKNSIHILGNDTRAKFLAHALQKTFDSVHMIGKQWPNGPYQNVLVPNSRGRIERVPNVPLQRQTEQKDDETAPISNLIVTGSPTSCVSAMESVRHRIDADTSVCLMHDGLGVAEEVDRKIFKGKTLKPAYLLGHMGPGLGYHNNTDSVRVKKPGRTALVAIEPGTGVGGAPSYDVQLVRRPATSTFIHKMAAADYLEAGGFPFDQWLKLKLPPLIFSAVVDPICVVLDSHYKELLGNTQGARLINQLLCEIADVVGLLPELQHSPELAKLIRGESIRKRCFGGIRGKGNEPSKMRLQISKGKLTDINFLNGYFLKRAGELGMRLPANEFVMGMVKAKHAAQRQKLKSMIPWDDQTFLPTY